MKQLLSRRVIPLAALCCAAFALTVKLAPVTAAQPSKDEYCVSNGAGRSCAETLEQCQAASAGIGGSCVRSPSATAPSNAHAQAPGDQRHRRKAASSPRQQSADPGTGD
jgi:hypothetical protein